VLKNYNKVVINAIADINTTSVFLYSTWQSNMWQCKLPVVGHAVHTCCLWLLSGHTLCYHSQLNSYACQKHITKITYMSLIMEKKIILKRTGS